MSITLDKTVQQFAVKTFWLVLNKTT